MPLTQIAVDVRGDVVILDPAGRICLCDDRDGLPPVVAKLLEEGFLKVLLNLHRVRYIDSTSLAGIVRAHVMVTRKGGRLKIVNVVQQVQDVFDVTKLTPLLDVAASEESALRSFEGSTSTLA